jgi:excisionase family DNA binding protein
VAVVLDEPRTDTPVTLTVRDAAKMLGVSAPLVYRLAADGRVPSLKIGGRVLLRRDTVEALLDDRRDRSRRHRSVAP